MLEMAKKVIELQVLQMMKQHGDFEILFGAVGQVVAEIETKEHKTPHELMLVTVWEVMNRKAKEETENGNG